MVFLLGDVVLKGREGLRIWEAALESINGPICVKHSFHPLLKILDGRYCPEGA